MKRIIATAISLATWTACYTQEIIIPQQDSTFRVEYYEGNKCGIIEKNGSTVAAANECIIDDYGRFYRLTIRIINETNEPYTFDPKGITATLLKKRGNDGKALKALSARKYTRRVRLLSDFDAASKLLVDKKNGDYLKISTIHEGEQLCGYIYVKKRKGSVMTVTIPVNGEKYTFQWDVSRKAIRRSRRQQ